MQQTHSVSEKTILHATTRAFAVILGLLLILQGNNSAAVGPQISSPLNFSDSTGQDTIRLAFVGDLMCHASQFEKARTSTGYDFHPVFEPVKKYLSEADFTFGNLETVTAGAEAKFTGYPQFNTPAEFLDALKASGFDVLTTANNHSLDRRFPGVVRTLEELDKRNLYHTGTARSASERNTPLILQRGSVRLGVLAYTFSTNGIPIPTGQTFCVNMIDTAQIRTDVQATRDAGAEVIAAFMHWGDEYARFAKPAQIAVADFLHNLGVMLIIGSHPHVLQPSQLRGWGDIASFTVYSLGNFISGQRKQYTDCGMILRITLVKDRSNGDIKYEKLDYVPTYVSTVTGYRVLPVADALKAIRTGDKTHPAYTPDKNEQLRLEQVWKETTKHMDDYNLGLVVAEEN